MSLTFLERKRLDHRHRFPERLEIEVMYSTGVLEKKTN